jgi:hypothetical protein
MLVLYSDGVTEANNPAYDEFDEERFIEVLKAHRFLPAAQIVQKVIRAVTDFAASIVTEQLGDVPPDSEFANNGAGDGLSQHVANRFHDALRIEG